MAKTRPWYRQTAPVEDTLPLVVPGDASLEGPPVYHDNDTCELGRQIPEGLRADGTGNLDHCPECHNLDE